MKMLIFGLLILYVCFPLNAQNFGGGSGTENDPYLINNLNDLVELREAINANNNNYEGKYFKQTADINLNIAPHNEGSGWDPIGNNSTGDINSRFSGIYDGGNYSIIGIYISGLNNYVGLFGYAAPRFQINNLAVLDVNIIGSEMIGALIGVGMHGTINNCNSSGNIIGTGNNIGGLAGNCDITIINCYSTVNVTGDRNIGGLIGSGNNNIKYCFSTGSVTGTRYIGGLIGYSGSGIKFCYSTGNVEGNDYLGGLVGYNSSILSNCYSTGDVKGSADYVGGLVGRNVYKINNCYSTGVVEGFGSYLGGLAGDNYNNSWISNCFWDIQTSGQAASAGGTGKTTDEMKTEDFVATWGWSIDVWERIGYEYPHLKPEPSATYPPAYTFSGGSGTYLDPYLISNINDLVSLRNAINDINNNDYSGLYLKQTANINLNIAPHNEGSGWDPIGNNSTNNDSSRFTGIYDGDGYIINGLFIDKSDTEYLGLFGYTNGAQIKNVSVQNIQITGSTDYIGGLVGYNYGSTSIIRNCYSTGSVNGTGYYTGGLVGRHSYGTISNCYSTCTVEGNTRVGGLLGYNWLGAIKDSYSNGNVEGSGDRVGGLVGFNRGDIYNCSNSGNVTGANNYTGGLVGYTRGNISGSYNSGGVSGTNYVGGLVGWIDGHYTVSNCYSTGSVSGINYVGGLVGDARGYVNNCYSTGVVTASQYFGGHIGNYFASGGGGVLSCFWDVNTSGLGENGENNYGATGKLTEQMKMLSTFTDAGWDFIDTWGMDAGINAGYPYLLWYNAPDVPLPITLTDFKATFHNGDAELSWQTASETENAAFRIYRDNKMITEIEGSGTTSEPNSYEYIDDQIIPGKAYTYVLSDVTYANVETKHIDKAITVVIPEQCIPQIYTLGTNYPNPWNPTTTIRYALPDIADVNLTIYDITGRKVKTLINAQQTKGYKSVVWDGKDNYGNTLSSGMYIYRLKANDFVDTKKMVFMK